MPFLRTAIFFILPVLLSSCLTGARVPDETAELHMQIGIAHIDKGNLPLALKELLRAEEIDSKNYLVQNNLGLVYFLRHKYELAIQHFTSSYELNPQFTDAKNNLARVLIEVQQYKKAEKLLKEVLDDLTYTNSSAAYMNLGLLYFNQKKYTDSRISFRKVLESQREDCYGHIYLGRSYLELKEARTASEQLDKAIGFCAPLKIDDAYYFSAIAYYRLGMRDKSLVRFEEMIKLFPEGSHRENANEMIKLIHKGHL